MIILSIETSCDDTGISLVEKKKGKLKTLASTVSSQDEIHKKWGGVYPSDAKREHQKNIIPSLEKTLQTADLLAKGSVPTPEQVPKILAREKVLLGEIKKFFNKYRINKKIDAIAVTVGPGLEPCLWVGVNFARALSVYLNTPIIPVNHIKAHILFFLFEKGKIKLPAVALIASGGHTELILMESLSSYKLIGKTRDDAAGECFDKTARMLGLGYPGGPAISARAEKFKARSSKLETKHNLPNNKQTTKKQPKHNLSNVRCQMSNVSITLPRPMKHAKNYDFSFSGLKTAVLYDFLSRNKKTQNSKDYISEMAYEVEEAITDVLVFKLKKATEEYGAKTVILGGGVTANKTLQEKIKNMQKDFPKADFFVPSIRHATDNAEIIGAVASVDKTRKDHDEIEANANLKIYDTIV